MATTFISLAYQNDSESQFRQAQMNGGAGGSSAFLGVIFNPDVNDLPLDRAVGFTTLDPTDSIIPIVREDYLDLLEEKSKVSNLKSLNSELLKKLAVKHRSTSTSASASASSSSTSFSSTSSDVISVLSSSEKESQDVDTIKDLVLAVRALQVKDTQAATLFQAMSENIARLTEENAALTTRLTEENAALTTRLTDEYAALTTRLTDENAVLTGDVVRLAGDIARLADENAILTGDVARLKAIITPVH
jgi:hypothetical protein